MRLWTLFIFISLLFGCGDNINKVRISQNFKVEGTATIAILTFKTVGTPHHLGDKVSEKFAIELVRTNKFRVIDRENARNLFQEAGFQSNLETMGALDEKTKVSLKQLGAQYLMTGSIFNFDERKRYEDNFVLYSRVHVTAKLINIETGEVVWSSERMKDSKAVNADEKKSKSLLKVELPAKSAEKVLDDIITEMVDNIVKHLHKK
ncbi:MAG: penicillin-binding protein activator LpoB [Deferribacterales bacterium]